ncbi:calcium-binding protein [Desulfobulbus oralis]|uniref:calcium-binding protein n=1 Tax=Desulfobulbus oralis TaxID=1986146 RepID=UPI0015E3F293|nr:calcium-binding protein [Desulfobulbus oralis]
MDGLKGLFGTAGQDPIVLDLDGDGVETLGQDAGVFFDHDGNGFAQLSGWVAPDDGLLVWDRNGNGQIDDGSELFGNNSLLENGQKAANGFAALAELDKNKDGVLDASDAAFAALRVWRDKNSDGQVGEGELLTLDELGIQSLCTSYTVQQVVDANGNALRQQGSFTYVNGSTGQMGDVWFAEDTARTLPTELVEVPEEIAALPDVMAFGNVYSLHQAMARDGSGALKSLVERFAAETDVAARQAILEQLIYTWAGVAGLAPDSRGGNIDARIVAAMEAFMGSAFRQGGSSPNPNQHGAKYLSEAFARLKDYVDGQLMAQTHLAPLLAGIKLSIDPATWELSFDFSRSMALLQESWTADSGRCSALLQSLVRYLSSYGEDGERVLDAFRAAGDLDGDAFAFAVASAGLQVLRPGTGDQERLSGTAGDDLYLIAPRGGQEITISSGEGKDRLRFGEGIGLSDIRLEQSGYDLIIRVGESGQSVKLEYWYYPNYADRRVDVFAFADGRSLSWQELLAQKAVSLATEGGQLDGNEGVDDVLRGSTLAKAGSTETLRGLGGRDRLYAGLSQTASLYGGRDDDQLFTNAAATSSSLYGEDGDDLLVNQSGSAATTRMTGGAGSDEYLIQAGSGETVIELDGDTESTDTLRFGEGIGLSDIRLEQSGYDLIIRVGESGQSVKLEYWYYPNYADRRVDVFAFADGRSLSWQELLAQKAVSLATEGGQLDGNEGVDDVLRGSTVAKAGSTETLRGLGGRDRLYAGLSSTASLYGGRDDDQLFTNAAATKSYLYGEEGDDLLVNQSGSAATTRMTGGAGSDEYLIQAGSGETVIELDGDTESTDTLRFGEGIGLSDIRLEQSGYDLIIRVGESGQSVKLEYWYYPNYADRRVDVFAFADGRSLSWQELLAQKAVSLATEGGQLDGNEGVDDVLRGSTVAKAGSTETLRGLGGGIASMPGCLRLRLCMVAGMTTSSSPMRPPQNRICTGRKATICWSTRAGVRRLRR